MTARNDLPAFAAVALAVVAATDRAVRAVLKDELAGPVAPRPTLARSRSRSRKKHRGKR
ncbi:hypothetical protein [Limnoglobus roseus]|uniref:Uncharacterized protein n=1 Tax=Limnoglobus roseus TaxID=2598579 RepID=A0A5C1AH07_9BACT|nr:hypothetical protein [Limnoglobus roseus]QEL17533.1 hypothetical protein PX52LOC_04523 [Limnoglobus roseus]